MLFAIDVGNTNITIGLFDKDKLVKQFRMITKTSRTSDEYGVFLRQLLLVNGIEDAKINAVIISSVVPNIMHSLTSGIIKYFDVNPLIVAPGIKSGIRLAIPNPKELGADRLVDAVAAYELYGGPVIVVDFGTATTHDLVLADGTFAAGVTSPGIRLAANALWTGTAKLPEVEIQKVDTILGKDTVSSMQAGIYYGYIGQTEYIINGIKKESGLSDIKVVATGGLGKMISEATNAIDIYDPELTLHGLRIIYDKQ
ncbi:MAG: type III pantothenate kinase [Eubacterium sp.]|nr:type III pantothenate kinase [Eubacterium sp.]MEE3399090.1 type III pantothenate kinase [Eubacterium sp.]